MLSRVTFKTIGCRLNQAETAQMAAGFRAAGYAVSPFGAPCDVAVIHGCAITARAERDSLRAARQARRGAASALIVMAGCPAEVLGDALRGEPVIDLVVGQAGKFSIPALLSRLYPDRLPHPTPDTETGDMPVFDTTRALVKIQDGCDFGCAYCVVPRARGAPRSRPLSEIAEELARLAGAGFREVVLTGANLGCYASGRHRLVDVVEAAEAIPGITRIRLSSIELTTAERGIIDHMASSAKLCRFLHVPMQSGDDGILEAMGRRYTARAFREGIEYAAARVPDIGLGTDIIVGFPGEDEAAFERTVALARALPFSNLHVFPYSRRAGTRAAAMPGQVADIVKKTRLNRLMVLDATKRTEFAERFVGREVTVLLEGVNVQGTGHGWTPEYVETVVQGESLARRQIVQARIAAAEGGRLHGYVASHQ